MRLLFSERRANQTRFVILNTAKCIACWECLNSCQNKVIRKIDLPWHKHAVIALPDRCTGCLKCIKACRSEALVKTTKTAEKI